jgi:hypothetical protein
VERSVVVVREQRERLGLEDRHLVVGAGERANGVEGVEPGERDERDLAAVGTSQNLRAAKAGDRSHRREQLRHEELLVRVSVLSGRPTPP